MTVAVFTPGAPGLPSSPLINVAPPYVHVTPLSVLVPERIYISPVVGVSCQKVEPLTENCTFAPVDGVAIFSGDVHADCWGVRPSLVKTRVVIHNG